MIELEKVTKVADRLKWLNRFRKSYSGGLRPITASLYRESNRFLVAVSGKLELGFMRLFSTDEFAHYTKEEVWIVGEAYVKPPYRGKGVLREMITLAVRDHGAKGLHMETSRLVALEEYYFTLGFTDVYGSVDQYLSYAFVTSFRQVLVAANDDQFQQAA